MHAKPWEESQEPLVGPSFGGGPGGMGREMCCPLVPFEFSSTWIIAYSLKKKNPPCIWIFLSPLPNNFPFRTSSAPTNVLGPQPLSMCVSNGDGFPGEAPFALDSELSGPVSPPHCPGPTHRFLGGGGWKWSQSPVPSLWALSLTRCTAEGAKLGQACLPAFS
jgi:hypothetical protein